MTRPPRNVRFPAIGASDVRTDRAVMAADGLDGVLPAAEGLGAPGGVATGGKGLGSRLEQVGGRLGVGPETDAEAGEQGRAQGGGLGLRAAAQGEVEQVGLELEER